MFTRLSRYNVLVGALTSFAGVRLGNSGGLFDNAGAPTNGTSGTYAKIAGPGALLQDTTNGVIYANTNTKASPTWTQVPTSAPSSADGLGALGVARVTFDCAVVGNRTVAAHASTVTIPINSFIVGGFFQVNTAFTSAGGNDGTIAISVEGANDIQTAAAVSGAPYSTIGKKGIVPKLPDTSAVLTTAARAVTFTVAVDALTAGKLTLFLYYVVAAAQA